MLLLPIITPLLGAGLVLLARGQASRVRWLAYLVAASMTWFVVGLFWLVVPSAQQLSLWQPQEVFRTPLSLTLDHHSWVVIFAVASLLLSVALTGEARPGEGHTGIRMFMFAYVSFAMLALLGGDLVTLALGWVLSDLVGFGYLFASADTRDSTQTIATRVGVLLASSLLVFAGAALSQLAPASFSDAETIGTWLWVLAVLLRIGLFPLHIALPAGVGVRRGLGAMLRLLPPAMALMLFVRAPLGGTGPGLRAVLLAVATLGAIVGAVRWGLHEDAVRSRPFFVLGLTAIAPVLFLVPGHAGRLAITGTIALLILVGGSISIYASHVGWHRVWPVTLSALLLGFPYSAGAWIVAGMVGLYPIEGSDIALIAVPLMTLIMLAIGTFRLSGEAEQEWPSGEDAVRVTYTIGQSLPHVALVLVVLVSGLRPTPTETAASAALLALTAALTYGLRRTFASRRKRVLNRLQGLDTPDLFRVGWAALGWLVKLVRTLAAILEGRSALLWVVVILMVAGLFFGARGA